MAAIDYDYMNVPWSDGSTKVLQLAKGTLCNARPAVTGLADAQILALVPGSVLLPGLPALPNGWAYRPKNCTVGDGPWVEDNDNPPSFIPDSDFGGRVIITDPADQSGLTLKGIFAL